MHKMQARENSVWPHLDLQRIDLHLDEEVNSSRVETTTTAITSLTKLVCGRCAVGAGAIIHRRNSV